MKKTYKRMQNRLYREIKRRIIAENALRKPLKVDVCQRKIETVAASHVVRYEEMFDYQGDIRKWIKNELALKITNELLNRGYIEFRTYEEPVGYTYGLSRVDCRLNVVRPWRI